MKDVPDEAVDWAFALSPYLEGWRIKFLLDGARLTAGGALVHNLEEAQALIQSLIPLLKEDESTKQLLRLMNEPHARRKDVGGDREGSDGVERDRDLLQTVWEASADAMALSDPRGIVLHANPAYCRLYGYSPEEVIGQSFSIIFPEETRHWAIAAYERTFHDPAIAPDIISVIRRADGSERVVEARYNFVVRDGKRVAMLSTIRDVTEQKRLEQELRESVERFRAIWHHAADAVVLSDADGIVLEANPAFFALCGYRPEEVIGRSFAGIFPENQRDAVVEAYGRVFSGEERYTMVESVLYRADGAERLVETRYDFLTENGARTAMLSIIRDVTERQHLRRAPSTVPSSPDPHHPLRGYPAGRGEDEQRRTPL